MLCSSTLRSGQGQSAHGWCVRRVCGTEIAREQCVVKSRLDGKFVSFRVQAWVPAASCIQAVHDELSADSRIIMNF